ncbi:hypothetical protein D0P01_23005 [Salmonella enterica]|nr:hypothetical protein [Salmonella enterica]
MAISPFCPAKCSCPLEQRAEKPARTAGRAPVGSLPHHLVPLPDQRYGGPIDNGGHTNNVSVAA